MSAFRVPTTDQHLELLQITSEAEIAAWCEQTRTRPSKLKPDHWRAPDHDEYQTCRKLYMPEYGSKFVKMGLHHKSEIIGLFSLWKTGSARAAEIQYSIAPKYQQKGFGTLAVKAMVQFGTEELGFNEIVAYITRSNLASQKVVERSGFALQGFEPAYNEFKYVFTAEHAQRFQDR